MLHRCNVYAKRLSHAKQALADSLSRISIASAAFHHWRNVYVSKSLPEAGKASLVKDASILAEHFAPSSGHPQLPVCSQCVHSTVLSVSCLQCHPTLTPIRRSSRRVAAIDHHLAQHFDSVEHSCPTNQTVCSVADRQYGIRITVAF